MRTIGVVTGARSDYGLLRPVLERIESDPALELRLYVSGMHLSREYGHTVDEIEADGRQIAERVPVLEFGDEPAGIAKAMGTGTIGFAEVFDRARPDVLLLLGDRFETHAAAVAAVPFVLPVAHIHGGESTEGLIDEALRHSITKLSHLHFAATEEYARRIIQLGEEPWRVEVTGAPGLDAIAASAPLDAVELTRRYRVDLDEPTLLVTYHPVTLEYEHVRERVGELLAALDESGHHVVFTYPNADTGSTGVLDLIGRFVERSERATLVTNLGSDAYFSFMRRARAMVGNSSSGIIEAASFELPVVNVGARQQGRIHGENVIDVPERRDEILAAIRRATSDEFRRAIDGLRNPYGDGHASERIVAKLRDVPLDGRLLVKRFHEVR